MQQNRELIKLNRLRGLNGKHGRLTLLLTREAELSAKLVTVQTLMNRSALGGLVHITKSSLVVHYKRMDYMYQVL